MLTRSFWPKLLLTNAFSFFALAPWSVVGATSNIELLAAKTQLARLSQLEQQQLDSGKIVFFTKKMAKAPWPMLYFFSLIDATTLESVAVFAAYEHQKNYVPNIIRSEIIKRISDSENYTAYELKVPWPLPNSKYVHHHKFLNISPSHYQVSWDLIESNTTDYVKGKAEFIPYKGKTLFYYQNFVKPKSNLASLFESNMISDVKKSIEVIRDYTQKIKQSDQQLLNKLKLDITKISSLSPK